MINMREFRFRAWDDVEKKMLTPVNIFNTPGILFEDDENGNLNINLITDSHGTRRKLEMMLWTGSKDKNNVDVFEGDIIKIKRCFIRPFINDDIEIDYKFIEGDEEIGYIIWGWSCNKFLVSYEHIRYDDTEDFNTSSHRIEVIGNKFETPKLIMYKNQL